MPPRFGTSASTCTDSPVLASELSPRARLMDAADSDASIPRCGSPPLRVRLGFVPFPHATLPPCHPTATRAVLPRRGCVCVAHRAGRSRSPSAGGWMEPLKPRPPRYSLLPASSWRGAAVGQWRVRAAATHGGGVAARWFPTRSHRIAAEYREEISLSVRRVRLGPGQDRTGEQLSMCRTEPATNNRTTLLAPPPTSRTPYFSREEGNGRPAGTATHHVLSSQNRHR